LKYDNDLIIEPRRGKNERPLPESAILVLNPAEADGAFKQFKRYCSSSQTINQSSVQVDEAREFCLAGPALGASAATLLLEKMIVLGVRKVWLVSCCGALDPAFSIGDLVLGRSAVSGEGVSRYYTDRHVMNPDPFESEKIASFAEQFAGSVEDGVIWSTDAPYRERRSTLVSLREEYGVSAVDMEFSALCAVAAHRGISFGGLFVVSDLLWTRNWKPGFSFKGFKKRNSGLIKRLVDCGLSRML